MPEKIDYKDAAAAAAAEELSVRLVATMVGMPLDERRLLLERTVSMILFGPFAEQHISPEEAHAIMDMYWGRFLSDVEVEISELRLQRPPPPSPGAGS